MRIFGARCIVKEIKQDNDTNNGIIIPGRDKEPTYFGTVIEIGNGAILEDGTKVEMQIKSGDKVIYTTFSGSPININGETFLVLNERDILGVLEDGDYVG